MASSLTPHPSRTGRGVGGEVFQLQLTASIGMAMTIHTPPFGASGLAQGSMKLPEGYRPILRT